jgi:hypothetical protein
MKISLRMVLIALVVLVAIGSMVSTIPSEDQTSAGKFIEGQCQENHGVSLVVDFGTSSNREAIELCALDFKQTGWDIFAAVGLEVEGTSEYPTGFVCRLAGWPTLEEQPCSKTPTGAQGSWAYFSAAEDKGWQFSGQGAAMRKPTCGTVEGWRFVESGEVASQSWPRVDAKTSNCK